LIIVDAGKNFSPGALIFDKALAGLKFQLNDADTTEDGSRQNLAGVNTQLVNRERFRSANQDSFEGWR
jgi:hypothetical protein